MVSFVYFDVGGVVILDFSGTNKWAALKKEWGITPQKDSGFEKSWPRLESDLCAGKVPKGNLPGNQNYTQFLHDFVSRFEINRFIWPVIVNIHQKCKVGLLTNQYPGMLKAIQKRSLMPDVSWDVIIDSSVDKVQKPNSEIFELAERRSGFKGQEILFVENNEKHVEAAVAFGWQTFLYDSAHPQDSSNQLHNFLQL